MPDKPDWNQYIRRLGRAAKAFAFDWDAGNLSHFLIDNADRDIKPEEVQDILAGDSEALVDEPLWVEGEDGWVDAGYVGERFLVVIWTWRLVMGQEKIRSITAWVGGAADEAVYWKRKRGD